MSIKKGVLQLKRTKYVFFDLLWWRIRISYYKMGKSCNLRINFQLGKDW